MDADAEIFVKTGGGIVSIGDGFTTHESVESVIETRFGAGEYTYGMYSEIAACEIPELEYTGADLDAHGESVLEAVEAACDTDNRVESFARLTTGTSVFMASFNAMRIRYDVSDVDFAVELSRDEFDDLPVSTFDEKAEAKMKRILNELSENTVYLGFESTYERRGLRDPFITVYGRVERKTNQDIETRSLYDHPGVETILWTTDNLSPIPIRVRKSYTHGDEDLVVVLTHETDNDFESITESEYEWVTEKDIAGSADTLTVEWVGKIGYGKSTGYRLCIGVSEETPRDNTITRSV